MKRSSLVKSGVPLSSMDTLPLVGWVKLVILKAELIALISLLKTSITIDLVESVETVSLLTASRETRRF